MGYNNSYTLRVTGQTEQRVKVCQNQHTSLELKHDFCPSCGSPLLEKVELVDARHLISEFFNEYVNGDAGYLLNEHGTSEEDGSGYSIHGEVMEFSKKHPHATFILSCQWESGAISEGSPGTDYFFFKNGIEKKSEAIVIYTDPFTGEQFKP